MVAHRSCENPDASSICRLASFSTYFLEEIESPMLDEQLQEAIKNSGKSINSIAIAAGVPQPVLQRFVSGERDIRLETTAKIADYFGMRLTKPKG